MEARRFITRASTSQIHIDLPDSMVNKKIEIVVTTLEEGECERKKTRKRRPPIELAGKVKELGNVMDSVPLSDWGIE